ncbi:MAG: protein translocase subunit SecDF [Flammeovirgaceae bacterium]|nr:protein translocase subunit SecDF [Flammeovirgaceae bacterium]
MQNRNGIVLLTIIITVLSIFYLSFTLVSRKVQSDADEYAMDESGTINANKKQAFMDSIWNEPVYPVFNFTYKEVKESELNLGLDLKGGMHVTLEVSPAEILIALSGNNNDPNFRQALKMAGAQQSQSRENYTTLFFNSLGELSPNASLASFFANTATKGRIDFDTEDDEVKKVIESEVEDAIDRTFNIIRTRIDKFGVSQPEIQRVQGTGRIQIELPGVDNPQRVRKLLQGVAKLEFLEVWRPQEYSQYLMAINEYIVKKQKAEEADGVETGSTDELFAEEENQEPEDDPLFADDNSASSDTTAQADSTQQALEDLQSQYSELLTLNVLGQTGGLGYMISDTAKINNIIYDPEVKSLIPPNMYFMWNVKPRNDENGNPVDFISLNVLKKERGGKAPLTGEVVEDAQTGFDQFGRPDISMKMNVEGAKKWKKLTGNNVGNQIAIVLDSYVYSAPMVQGEIPNGSSSISGDFSVEEAKDLANVLKAGKLPASPRIVEEAVVGPSLGKEAQIQGIRSVIFGLILVVIFMIAYYAKGGMVANVALLINIFFIFGILAQLNAALTLPGIAGIVLTIGMSIDANVLIFERIREELKIDPSNLLNAIKLGYEKAFWTIFDSNVTTMLTAIFLYSFGAGPIKGFAITLMIGIACSFFSAVYITRVIVTILTRKGNNSSISFVTPLSRKMLSGMSFEFIGKRKVAYVISSVLIVLGIGAISTNGLNFGVDFQGGRSYIVEFRKDIVPSDLQVDLQGHLENSSVQVKTFGGDQKMKITTNYLVEDESTEADNTVMNALIAGISEFSGDSYESNSDLIAEGKFTIPSTAKVGATIADDIKDSAFTSVIFALIAIFMYIWVRFRNWKFGLGAIIALFHDALIVLSMFAFAFLLGIGFEIDQVFIAALLTVIGYSINDTVVVFDRVREFLGLRPHHDLHETMNDSINSTLNRTLITSVTTLLVVIILFLFGGEVLRGFSFALLVGILVGTYSSIFVATPIVYDAMKLEEKQTSKKEGPVKAAKA